MPKSDQGISESYYQVIPRVLIFVFNSAGNVLLIKGAEHKQRWPGLYNGIGGHIEAGESILEAAHRELFEETGLDNDELRLCGQVMVDASDETGIAIFIFKGYHDGDVFRSSPEGEVRWVKPEDLVNLPIVEDLLDLIPRIASQKDCDPLLIGKYTYDEEGNLVVRFS
jgi:8-oxo-dGTP diphosphatase